MTVRAPVNHLIFAQWRSAGGGRKASGFAAGASLAAGVTGVAASGIAAGDIAEGVHGCDYRGRRRRRRWRLVAGRAPIAKCRRQVRMEEGNKR